ncbi:MAG: hypothetical protein QHH10_06670 [Peptococcaceae bacterium]|jgi:hypothetical protein|nr:hypothetical protein [Peptococcaceae bacterium]MDH7524982.1 hypothetical protein [Peptococcaceae bacterium]
MGVLKKEGNSFLDGIRLREDVHVLDWEYSAARAIKERIELFLHEQGITGSRDLGRLFSTRTGSYHR